MAANLKGAEYLADTISHKLDQLLSERIFLRKELARKSDGSLEQEKAFVQSYRNAIIDNCCAAERASRLEHMLRVR